MIKITTSDIEQYGINLFGQFIEMKAEHNLENDLVTLKLIFNNTVYSLQASFNDFLTEEGCANVWSHLILRCLLNHEKGTKTIQASDEDIQKLVTPKK